MVPIGSPSGTFWVISKSLGEGVSEPLVQISSSRLIEIIKSVASPTIREVIYHLLARIAATREKMEQARDDDEQQSLMDECMSYRSLSWQLVGISRNKVLLDIIVYKAAC